MMLGKKCILSREVLWYNTLGKIGVYIENESSYMDSQQKKLTAMEKIIKDSNPDISEETMVKKSRVELNQKLYSGLILDWIQT